MLKMTDIQLEHMTGIDMFQFIEKGMRGGISYIAYRYGRASNKYMSDYDPSKPSKYIYYVSWCQQSIWPSDVTVSTNRRIQIAEWKEGTADQSSNVYKQQCKGFDIDIRGRSRISELTTKTA